MGPVSGAELLIILLLALIFLGPQKLPEAARQIGRVMAQLRRVSAGFEREMREAMHDLTEEEARERGRQVGRPRPDPGLPRPASATDDDHHPGASPNGSDGTGHPEHLTHGEPDEPSTS